MCNNEMSNTCARQLKFQINAIVSNQINETNGEARIPSVIILDDLRESIQSNLYKLKLVIIYCIAYITAGGVMSVRICNKYNMKVYFVIIYYIKVV